jgi:hypothetical protein
MCNVSRLLQLDYLFSTNQKMVVSSTNCDKVKVKKYNYPCA